MVFGLNVELIVQVSCKIKVLIGKKSCWLLVWLFNTGLYCIVEKEARLDGYVKASNLQLFTFIDIQYSAAFL